MTRRYRWVILAVSYGCNFTYALVYQALPPILSLVISDLHLSHAQAGSFMSLFSLPGIFLSIPSGHLSDRYGAKRICASAFVLMILGTMIVSQARAFPLLGLGRVVSGLGAITVSIIAPQLVSQWFSGRELGIAMGIFNTAMPMGTIVSFNALGLAGKTWGWRRSVLISTLVSATALMAFLLAYRRAPATNARPRPAKGHGLFSNVAQTDASIWLVGLTWMWFTGSSISFFTFAPDFLLAREYDMGAAGFWASFPMWGSLLLGPVIGYLIDRMGKKGLLIGFGAVSSALLMFLLPSAGASLSLLIMGLSVTEAFVPVAIFSLPPDILEPHHLGLGFGILTACSNVGVLSLPYLVGLATDRTGSYHASFALMAVFMLLAMPTIGLLELKRRWLKGASS
jgi:MFS family permease